MAQVITALQQKGGAGKSTMISCIAASMASDGAKVLLIDTDPQRSCIDWAEKNDINNLDTFELADETKLESAILKFGPDYDAILIDTAGYDSQMAIFAVNEADLVLIPSGGSRKDVMGAATTWALANNLTKKFQKPPVIRIAFWAVKGNTSVFRTARKAMDAMKIQMVSGQVSSLTGFDAMSWVGGLPTGAAAKAVNGFMASLQTDNLLDFYKDYSGKGAEHGQAA